MGIDASKLKITASEAYNLLDQKDGNVGDKKIGASVWNELVKSVEFMGGQTDVDIEENKAFEILHTFIRSSGEKYLNQLYKFLGYNIEEAQSKANDNIEKAEDVLQKVANGEIKITKSSTNKNEDGSQTRELTLENGMTVFITEEENKIISVEVDIDNNNYGDVQFTWNAVKVDNNNNDRVFELKTQNNDDGGYDYKKYQALGKQIVSRVKGNFLMKLFNGLIVKNMYTDEFIAKLTPEQQQDIENGMSYGEFNEKYPDVLPDPLESINKQEFGVNGSNQNNGSEKAEASSLPKKVTPGNEAAPQPTDDKSPDKMTLPKKLNEID